MRRSLVLAACVLTVVTFGCGGGPASSESSLPVQAGRFRLDEWSITADRADLPSGRQTITATNTGHKTHELVIVAARDAAELPTNADGSVDEDRLEAVTVGEIADVASGTSKTHEFDLAPGSYVAFCNVVDQMGHGNGMGGGMSHVHFEMGMHTTFSVKP